jgi:hypothetical protein
MAKERTHSPEPYSTNTPATLQSLGAWTLDHLRQEPPPPNWLVEGLIEAGKVIDFFGAPGEGKTTITNHLSASIAADCSSWFGLPISSGRVVMLGGEVSDLASAQRQVQRLRRQINELEHAEPDRLAILPSAEPIWRYDEKRGWELTEYGARTSDAIAKWEPILVVIDTMTGAANFGRGAGDLVSVQYQLGKAVIRWARDVRTTVITISHTNQSSAAADISERLNFRARTGTNGWPGAMRSMAGVTRMHSDEAMALGYKGRSVTAFGIAKSNEHPRQPVWTEQSPALFTYSHEHGLLLAKDGREISANGGIEAMIEAGKERDVKKGGVRVDPFG